MKIERSKLKKSNSELPEACRPLRDSLVTAKDDHSMYEILKKVKSWEFGKSELFHWVDVLDKFDSIMERCCAIVDGNKWMLACDQPENAKLKLLMLQVMKFTSMLIEYSFQRHSYESMDYLISLLSSSDMDVVHEVLTVLYVFSKRSNFMGRLSPAKKREIVIRLLYLAESWGGKENGFGLAECCQDLAADTYPSSATTVHFEFYINKSSQTQPSNLCTIHLENVDKLCTSPAEVMTMVLKDYEVPESKQMLLFTHIRLAHSFSHFKQRTNCILARLQAISVLVYSHAGDNDVAHQIIYTGFINELVNVLELPSEHLIDMKAAVMRTLTAIIHLERNPKLDAIIDVTGANIYHGFLPSLVRKCIVHMVEPDKPAFPHSFSTALFSFLYHLASYESGGEALLACGIMPSLLQLASWYSDEQEHITFVTRAVRIIDLITNMDTVSFDAHNGLKVFIERLDYEVTICRKEQPNIIRPSKLSSLVSIDAATMDVSESSLSTASASESVGNIHSQQVDLAGTQPFLGSSPVAGPSKPSADGLESMDSQPSLAAKVVVIPVPKKGVQCLPQRSALLKSILNFFKKVIPEPTLSFADSIRHIMEGSMPKALQHIISNAEYYGASLFLLALDVVTVFVFQEPSLLSSLQDKGLTEVVLESLLVKDVPTTREVLAALPNVFSALCLNQRGLDAFVSYKPFDKLFKVLLSPEYLPAMKKRKSSDAFGDTAGNLGTAMDELMRHQPSLREPAISAIIGLMNEIIRFGTDKQYVCVSKASEAIEATTGSSSAANAPSNSDIESEDDEEVTEGDNSQIVVSTPQQTIATEEVKTSTPKPIPLIDYIHNVMKFVDAIMGNTSSDDHCMEFINQEGLEPLFTIVGLPNLPVDFPTTQAFQAVSNVCTVLLKLCHEPLVLQEGIKQLSEVLDSIGSLYEPLPPPGGSVLLNELANAVGGTASISDAVASSTLTPLLHRLTSVQLYVKMLANMCKFGQADLKEISLSQWSSQQGMEVLEQLGKLYYLILWEGTVLLAVCGDNDRLPAESDFGRADMAKLLPKLATSKDMDTESNSSVGVTAAMEGLSTADMMAAVSNATSSAATANDEEAGEGTAGDSSASTSIKKPSALVSCQLKNVRPLVHLTSRLGNTLAELFQQVLVKLCVGSVMLRQRRGHHQPPMPPVPSANARTVVKSLCKISVFGLSWKPPTDANVPKLKMSFLMCSAGFIMLMLFEENKRSYHLMLQEFINSKGHEALFAVFDHVLGQLPPAESFRGGSDAVPTLPGHCIDFLDTWLLLVEKMVNPKLILDSIYPLPEKGNNSNSIKFNPTDYLKQMLKPVFDCILKLWNHQALTNTKNLEGEVLGELEQVALTILTILGHIIQAEKMIKEKEQEAAKDYSKSKSAASTTSSLAAGTSNLSAQPVPTRPGLAPVSEDNELLRDLMDMGFARESCVEALNFTSTVEQATEYLISHTVAGVTAGGAQSAAPAMETSLTEDEQIRAAIELSLTTSPNETESRSETKPEAVTESQPSCSSSTAPSFLTTEDLDELTENLVAGCMNLLDAMPNTVFKICQLLVTVWKRNGDEWKQRMFKQLFLEITDVITQLSEDSVHHAWGSNKGDATQYFKHGEKNCKLAARMHLLTLLIQEVDTPCISILQENGFIDSVLNLIQNCLPAFRLTGSQGTPRWLAPVMLIIDQCEKAAVASKRKAKCRKVLGDSTAWKWFDDRNGRWCAYNSTSNNVIDTAYKSGETSVRFSAGRRKYLVQFNAMLQLNEDTGNRRPVMLSIPSQEEREKSSVTPMDIEFDSMSGLTPGQITSLIKCCVDLISVPVECETLHAVLRLCLRFTREHEEANLFVDCGGVDQLLALTQASFFTGFTSLCTLLLRHVLEDKSTLAQCMTMVLKEVVSGLGSTLTGVSSNSIGSKEIHYVMRQLGPAMCRSTDQLKTLAQQHLSISLHNGKEPPWSSQHQVDILSYSPEKATPTSASSVPSNAFRKIITSLLNILIVPYSKPSSEHSTSVTEKHKPLEKSSQEDISPTESSATAIVLSHTSVLQGLLATNDSTTSSNIDMKHLESKAKSTNDEDVCSSSTASHSQTKPLLSKSCILRMLSEFVRSYPMCANLIIQHVYLAGQSDLIDETCTALTFIFDKLLPSTQEHGDKDCPTLCKMFLASLASCNHSIEAQTVLVNELRLALQKTLAMSEMPHKYTHIQTLTGLVSSLIEACPGAQSQLKPSLLIKTMNSSSMNQIVKLMVKRGLVSDIARIPHSLDLSNPSAVNTINCLLKPLESLSRIVNLPQIAPTPNVSKVSTVGPPAEQMGSSTERAFESAMRALETPAEGREGSEPGGGQPASQFSAAPADTGDIPIDVDSDSNEAADESNITDNDVDAERARFEERHAEVLNNIADVEQQVNEVLEQALDEILSQGRSDHSADDDDVDRDNSEVNLFDIEEVDPGEDDRQDDDEAAYHEEEEEDTSDEEDDDDDDDEDDNDEDGENAANADAGELGMDDEGWSEEDELNEGERLANILAIDDDDDLFSQLEAYDSLSMEHDLGRPRVLLADPSSERFRALHTLHLPVATLDANNDDAVTVLPPAPTAVPVFHPLLNPNTTVNTEVSRSQSRFVPGLTRTRRPAGNARAFERLSAASATRPGGSVFGLPALQHHPPTTHFLQRLLGAGVTANILQLTTRGTNSGAGPRVYISENDSFNRSDHEPLSDFLQDGMELGKNNGGPGILNAIPSTLYRWIEECRVLDGASVHDVVTANKSEIVDCLQAIKKEQLEAASQKEKRSKEKKISEESSKVSSAKSITTSGNASSADNPTVTETAANSSDLDAPSSTRDTPVVAARNVRQMLQSATNAMGTHLSEQSRILNSLAQGVASLYNQTQELQSLVSAAANTSSTAAVDTSSIIRASSEPLPAIHSLPTSNSVVRSDNPTTTTPLPESSSTLAPLSSTMSAVDSTDADLPVLATGQAVEVIAAEQDRACTPPNIFYDADVPAPPPCTESRPDEPVPNPDLEVPPNDSEIVDERSEAVGGNACTDTHPRDTTSITAPVVDSQNAAAEPDVQTVPPSDSAEPVAASTQADSSSLTLPPGLEGVDPSFLEALPESIRREVIAEQLRLARIQSQVRENNAAALASTTTVASSVPTTSAAGTSSQAEVATGGSGSLADVSAEFLAALPPAIQEEVLAVQRAEQARQAAVESGVDNTQDPGSFLNSLPATLRQQVLADMDDSQISVLPADLMAEAHLLRGELEDRSRRMHNQLFSGNISLGSMLRQSGLSGMTPSRYMRRGVGGSSGFSNIWSTNSGAGRDTSSKNVIRRGRQLLDQEGLTCLLVLLFLDEPRLNVSRLHRILKNLSFHNGTLLWIIRALISILFKTNSSKEAHAESSQVSSKQASQSAWLSFGMDAALGCRANVFQVQHSTTKRSAAGTSFGGSVNIHPQAAQLVCQHVMDALIYLSKVFTSHFLPPHVALPADSGLNKDKENSPLGKSKSPKHQSSTSPSVQSFWEVLIRLDQMRLTRKGKGVQRVSTSVSTSASLPPSSADEPATSTSIEESPLGQLMNLLSSSVIRRSPTLTDRLLKLLSSISTAIFPEGSKPPSSRYVGSTWWDSVEGSKIKPQAIVDKSTVLLPNQLRLAVEVLTSKSCSEEGLEDSTRLLVRLSNANQVTKQNIVQLLLSGAQQIGYTVCKHIESLLNEVVEYNRQQALAGGAEPPSGSDFPSAPDLNSLDSDQKPSTSAAAASSASSSRGLIPSRFQEGVMVTIAPPKTKTRTHELQLPSMSLLTTKSSSQQFLLRLLKVIIQLSDKKTPASTPSQGAAAASNQSSGLESAGGQEGADVAAAAGSSADDGASIPSTSQSTTMDMDTSPPNSDPPLCDRLALDKLWDTLGLCLTELANNNDQNAILILQPAVETFFLVHAGQKEATTAKSRRDQQAREDQLSHLNLDEPPPSPATSTTGPIGTTRSDDNLSPETKKFLGFAETHKTVLNQILRQSQTPLSDGPFSVLVDHMKLLDFDVKNRYFKAELQKLDEGIRREDLAVHVRRDHVFEDSYRELFRRTADEWKHRLYIVFEGEEGQDAGGLLREWYMIMSREIFNPNYALFMLTPQDRVTYTINQLSYYNSEHLSYFKFVGRVIAKAIYDNKLLECYFTRSFYKHITGQPVRYTDMEAEDYSFYQGLEFLLNHDIKQLGYDLTFSTEIQELGVTQTRELKPNGTNIVVTEENKKEYVKLVCQLKMTGAIRKQLNAFLEGFYDVIPKYLISIFNEQELELLISGLPTVDIDDLKANAEYHKYTATSLQIVWFWRALRSFDQGERAKFLQFVTGTSKVPLQGFAYLEGMNGTQKFQIHRDDRSTDRLPCAHTCFNQLDLPAYETYDKLKKMLLLVINECSEGFGLA